MRFPWISRTKHDARVAMWRAEHEYQQDRGRLQEDTISSLKRRCAELQGTVDRLIPEVRDHYAARVAAEKAAELWEERCLDADADILAARREECPACKAKDQTVALMADVVDFERARHMTPTQPLPQATSALGGTKLELLSPDHVEDRKWVTDDEETVMHMMRTGQLGDDLEQAAETASEMLARIGAQNVVVTSAQ